MLPLADELLIELSAPDRRGAADLCLAQAESGMPLAELVDRVMAPAMEQVGDLWQSAVWSVVDEHIATGVAETALSAAAAFRRPPIPEVTSWSHVCRVTGTACRREWSPRCSTTKAGQYVS